MRLSHVAGFLLKKGAQPIYMSPFRMGPCASYRRIQPIGPISHGLHPHAHPPIGPRMEGRFPAMVLRTRTMLDAKWLYQTWVQPNSNLMVHGIRTCPW